MLLYRERQPCLSKKQSHWPRSYRYKRPPLLKYHLDPLGKRLRREYCRTGKRSNRNNRLLLYLERQPCLSKKQSHWPRSYRYKRPPLLKYHLDPLGKRLRREYCRTGKRRYRNNRLLLYLERQPCLSKKQSHWPRSYRYKRPPLVKYHLDPQCKRLRREYCRTGKRSNRTDRMLLYLERQPCLSKKQSHWPRSYRYKRPPRLKYHLDPLGKRLRREYCRTGKRRVRTDRCCFIWSDNLV